MLVIGESFFSFMTTVDFSAQYRPSNTEGRKTWGRHLEKQKLVGKTYWPPSKIIPAKD